MRKLIYDKGINDSGGVTQKLPNGKTVICPYYTAWYGMFTRVYSEKYQKKAPTYKGSTICEDWLVFSNFKSWMQTQDWHGKHLDKDIIIPGNKHYSPASCVFVSRSLNSLLTHNKTKSTNLPPGVTYHKKKGKYPANIKINGIARHIGYFDSSEDASNAYKKAKYDHIMNVAASQKDKRIKSGLELHAQILISS